MSCMNRLVFFAFLIQIALCACTPDSLDGQMSNIGVAQTTDACEMLENLDWKDKEETLQILETCYATVGDSDAGLRGNQIDSMLYLAYIYLADGSYQNIDRANIILKRAIAEMARDCDMAHGTYDNFCYMVHFSDDFPLPPKFNSINDAMDLYHMSLPCVYAEMILENPDTVDLLAPYFFSSRDASLPAVCSPFNVFKIAPINDIFKSDAFTQNVRPLNPQPPVTGTISFGLAQSNYHDIVKMLLFPEKEFKDTRPDNVRMDVHIGFVGNEQQTVYAADVINELKKYPQLSDMYQRLVDSVTTHYIEYLNISPQLAATYADMAAQTMVMLYVYRD